MQLTQICFVLPVQATIQVNLSSLIHGPDAESQMIWKLPKSKCHSELSCFSWLKRPVCPPDRTASQSFSMAAGSPVNASELPLDLVSPSVEVDAPLDDRDIELVQTTFEKVAALGPEAAGLVLFGHIFRIAPEAKELFPFAKDEETMWLPGSRLEKHGARVVSTVATAVSLLKDLDTLVPVLQTLGLKHVGYKVLPPHYEIVGQAFIATLDDALQTEFTEAVKNAYLKVWKIVQATMIGDNYAK